MHLFGERQGAPGGKSVRGSSLFLKLKSAAAISCLLAGTAPGFAQAAQTTQQPQSSQQAQNPAGAPGTQALPVEPAPNFTQPLYMRPQPRDFSKARGYWPNPIAPYKPTTAPPASFLNSPRLDDVIKNGKMYLSLSDAILLALENNYDIAIQRFNLNIADTDILRTRSGALFLGVNSGLVTGTLGGSGTTVASGGGPGGTSVGAGGAGGGIGGLTLSTNGGGPLPENMDPVLAGNIQLQRQETPESNSLFIPRAGSARTPISTISPTTRDSSLARTFRSDSTTPIPPRTFSSIPTAPSI